MRKIGTIKNYNSDKGYGFIRTSGWDDIFFHVSKFDGDPSNYSDVWYTEGSGRGGRTAAFDVVGIPPDYCNHCKGEKSANMYSNTFSCYTGCDDEEMKTVGPLMEANKLAIQNRINEISGKDFNDISNIDIDRDSLKSLMEFSRDSIDSKYRRLFVESSVYSEAKQLLNDLKDRERYIEIRILNEFDESNEYLDLLNISDIQEDFEALKQRRKDTELSIPKVEKHIKNLNLRHLDESDSNTYKSIKAGVSVCKDAIISLYEDMLSKFPGTIYDMDIVRSIAKRFYKHNELDYKEKYKRSTTFAAMFKSPGVRVIKSGYGYYSRWEKQIPEASEISHAEMVLNLWGEIKSEMPEVFIFVNNCLADDSKYTDIYDIAKAIDAGLAHAVGSGDFLQPMKDLKEGRKKAAELEVEERARVNKALEMINDYRSGQVEVSDEARKEFFEGVEWLVSKGVEPELIDELIAKGKLYFSNLEEAKRAYPKLVKHIERSLRNELMEGFDKLIIIEGVAEAIQAVMKKYDKDAILNETIRTIVRDSLGHHYDEADVKRIIGSKFDKGINFSWTKAHYKRPAGAGPDAEKTVFIQTYPRILFDDNIKQ